MQEYILAIGKPYTLPFKLLPVGLVSFVIAIAATWLCGKVALRLGIVDRPDNSVKTHKSPTPYLGGVAMFAGLAAGVLCALFFLPLDCPSLVRKWLFGIIGAGAVACVVGCLDDIMDIRPWHKVAGQVAAAIVLVAVGITPMLYSLAWPAKLFVDIVVVLVFVLGATNSLNLLDGLDGLCGGVTAIMAGSMLLLATMIGAIGGGTPGDYVRIIVCLALLGSTLGFLPFNYYPAKIFMGDAGSLLLGLNMAVMMVLFAEKSFQLWLASIVMFGLPILDTAVAFARRIINKRPLFASDRGHVYDQMVDRGLSIRKAVSVCYGLTVVYGLVGLVIGILPLLSALIMCAAAVLISAAVVWRKGYLNMTGLRGAAHKSE